MPATQERLGHQEAGRRGQELYDRQIKPHLRPEDDGKFIAIDVLTGEYELDEDNHAAVNRLRARIPGVQGLLLCVGQPATFRL